MDLTYKNVDINDISISLIFRGKNIDIVSISKVDIDPLLPCLMTLPLNRKILLAARGLPF